MMRRLSLAVLTLLVGGAVVGAPAAPAAACPETVPIDQVLPGMAAHGLTVTSGKTPEEFGVEVLGVLDDGIAPGVDMIIVKVAMADLDTDADGIWEGMSGSPVYSDDAEQHLIGAVSYGMAFGPSAIGGLTPAGDMAKLLDLAPAAVRVPASLRARIAAAGDLSAHQAAAGLERLRVPLAVSGLRGNRLQSFAARLGGGERFSPFSAGVAPPAAGDPAEIVAGGNFAAAMSYGDITAGGVGTVTEVCGDHVLAFGHPMNFDGPSALSAHTATAIAIQDDPAGPPFKIANIGGVVGTLDQDRLAGIRALLGDAPTPIPVTSTVTDGGTAARDGLTSVNRTREAPDVAAFHLVSNIDSVIDRVGGGRTELGWTVTGIAGGRPFSLSRNNRFADPSDISFASADELYFELASLAGNPFADVTFTGVSLTAKVREAFSQYRITGLQRFAGGGWVKVGDSTPVELTPGVPLRVRVLLAAYRSSAPVAPVELRLPVAADAGGDGTLDISGGSSGGGGGEEGSGEEPKSFAELLTMLRKAPRNDDVKAQLSLFGGAPTEGAAFLADATPGPVTATKQVAEVVNGSLSIPVVVAGGSEPLPSDPPTLNLSGKSSLALAATLRKGLHLTVRSSAPGRLVLKASVSKKLAHRLKLKKTVVATLTKRIGDGRSKVTLKFTPRAKKRLRHVKRVKLALKATITDLEGNRSTDRSAVTLKRR